MTIKQILEWPDGYRSGGFVLTVKTAKKITRVSDKEIYQDVMFTDGPDEIWGKLKLAQSGILRNTPIRIIICERRTYNVNNNRVAAIYVEEWQDARPKMTADEYEDEMNAVKTEHDAFQDKRIRGMVRHGLVCATIRKEGLRVIGELDKTIIRSLVDFIMDD